MPGFRHFALDDISRIRQDLRDRYQDGFPILKELLQNADDAGASERGGAARQLVVVLSKNGLAGASHPLLKTAGVAVLNDGSFTANDALSITSLGMSNKAGQAGAAGKFGLGLKSIFHWAEAFFYFSPQTFPEKGLKQVFPCDLLNPWWSREAGNGRHRDWEDAWEESRQEDPAAFGGLAKQALLGERWFGLWVPLRIQAHLRDDQGEVKPIEQRFPQPTIQELLGSEWDVRLAETLPLLRRLQIVRICELKGRELAELAKFSLTEGSRRMCFGLSAEPDAALSRNELTGSVRIANLQARYCRYVGIEQANNTALLGTLRQLRHWPNQTALGEDGADRQVPEKAEPHGAVVFARQPADGSGSLRIQHAVFLPLSEPEEVLCNGRWRYCLNLHGFFFVDSGRRHIQPFDDLKDSFRPDQATSELQVIKLWNRTLLREVVAPLVLPSLDAFVKQEQMESVEVETLVGAMRKSETLKHLVAWMCRGQRFVSRLQPGAGVWTHETWDAERGQPGRWIELPKPSFAERELFDLLPALKELCGQAVVSLNGKPCLADGKPQSPSDGELAGLLASVRATSFDNTAHLDYLLELIPDRVDELEPDSALASALVHLANQLSARLLPEDKNLAKQWKEFFKSLPIGSFVRLPVESPDAKIRATLRGQDLPVALVWADWREAEGKGRIPWSALSPLLHRLGSLELEGAETLKQRSNIAIRLLKACDNQQEFWPAELARLPLFTRCAISGQDTAISYAELQRAQVEQRLFTRGNEWATNLAKAFPGLQPILVDQSLADALGLDARTCEADACLQLMKRAAHLATDFSRRKPLFGLLLNEASYSDPESWQALRCLLHGQLTEWNNRATLFSEPEHCNAFVALAKLALAAANQSWRLISHAVSAQLRLDDVQRRSLDLRTTSAEEVQALVRKVGPEKVDCASLTAEECDTILLQFNDVEVLRSLNIHETTDGRRVSIGPHTYVDDGTFKDLPAEFNSLVTRLRPRPGYGRFDTVDGSNRLVGKLSWEAVIQIALDQSEPSQWHGTILTAIGQLGTLRAELRDRVREVPWLPLMAGGAVKPADVLHLPGAEIELDRLPSELLNGKIPILRLAESVRKHERFETFLKVVLPPVKDALNTLANLLKVHPAWSTGLIGDWTGEQAKQWLEALADAPKKALPVACLVSSLHKDGAHRELLPKFLEGISGRFSASAYAEVLKHLTASHEQAEARRRAAIEAVFLRYLRAVDTIGPDLARQVLSSPDVRLLNAAGQWKAAGELTWPTHGVQTGDQLNQQQAEALSSLRQRGTAAREAPQAVLQGEPFHEASRQTPQRLRAYFARWIEFVTRETIGAFLAILGDGEQKGLRAVAEDFLGQYTVDGIRDDIASAATQRTKMPLQEALAYHRFACVLHDRPTVEVPSVLGQPIVCHLGGEPETIFLGSGVQAFPAADKWTHRWLHLLRIDPADMGDDPERLCSLIRASAEQIIQYVFCQPGINLKPLWDRLGQPAQLHIRIAQNRVADAAQAFLRQVGAHRSPEVLAVLKEWDAADRRRAEAEEAGRRVPGEVHTQLAQAKTRLRQLLANHPETQQATLAAVRVKIDDVYGYKPDSAPFEIWQNADDAIVELAVLGYSTAYAERIGFVGLRDSNGLSFAHWGRLVNDFRGAEGRYFRECGFDEDLEKMVVQAISDKRGGEAKGQAVTGKFGLGFKSVFLVSDSPEVLSGSVDFVIRGGIYPVRLDAERREALIAVLKELAPDHWRRGTLIRLPWRKDGQINPDEVLGMFRRLAPLLVVFSRRLKRLRLFEPKTHALEINWKPRPVADRIEVGALEQLHGDVRRALVLSHPVGSDRAQILFGLGPDGFVALPDDVPVFWVTAPTRATPGYGFAVNGPFEPDVGRVQLALNSKRNEELADELARGVAERFKALWDLAEQDWGALRRKLGLVSAAAPLSFWESLWELVGLGFAEKCPKSESSLVAALARRILWKSKHAGLQRFYSECAALPTGLWGEHQCLTRLVDIRFEAAGALDREAEFLAASQWPAFRKRVRPAQIVSAGQVVSVLQRLEALPHRPETIHLATVVEWEVMHGEELRADPDTAARLGQLVAPDFLKKLAEGKQDEREEQEHKALSGLLPNVLFQAADGSWHKSAELVVAQGKGVDKDELMRAAFAPLECQLNPAYTEQALRFFLACRPELKADAEILAKWVLAANDVASRIAAVKYLLNGKLKEKVGEEVRSQKPDENWLWQLAARREKFEWFERNFSDDDLHQLRAYVLRIYDQVLRDSPPPPLPPPPPPLIQPKWTVGQLWLWWKQQREPLDDYVLEGEANWPLFHDGNAPGPEHRRAELKRLLLAPETAEGKALWYRLFGYACLVSAGRHMTELRRFWLGRLQPEHFWERTSAGDFSEATQAIFEKAVTAEFTNMAAGGEQAYFWRHVFYDIRKVHRMVQNEFPAALLELVQRGRGEYLRQFLRTGYLPGPEQPRWVGTFGQSADTPLGFIIRELLRLGVITDETVRPYAFFVCRPVLRGLTKIGWIPEADSGFSGEQWLAKLAEDPQYGPLLRPYFDIPLLHMGLTHREDKMPTPPCEP